MDHELLERVRALRATGRTPFFVQGPHDDADAVMRTLQRSVGHGKFHYLVQA